MVLVNLVKEMAAAKITNEMLAEKLSVHRNTIANRIDGIGNFSIAEALTVQKTFFPNLGIEYLFEKASEQQKEWGRWKIKTRRNELCA